jgi:hypothetical protein
VCCFLVFGGKAEPFPPRLEVALGRGRGGRLELWRDGRGVWRGNGAVSLLVRWLRLILLLLLLLLERGGRGCGGRHDCDVVVVAGGGRLVSATGTASSRERSSAAGEQSIRGGRRCRCDAMQKGVVMAPAVSERGEQREEVRSRPRGSEAEDGRRGMVGCARVGSPKFLKEVKAWLGEAIRLSEAPCSAGDWPAAGTQPRAPRASRRASQLRFSAGAFVDRESETGKSRGASSRCPLEKRVKRQRSILGGGGGGEGGNANSDG